MPISIRALRPSYPSFAGEVSEIAITPADRPRRRRRDRGQMDPYAVLVFRDQDLTDEQQLAFTLHFGELENYATAGHVRKREEHRLGPGIADFSNLDKHGNICRPRTGSGSSSSATGYGIPTAPSARCPRSIRCCPDGSSRPGAADTEFADMRAAYDALDERTKAEVEDLVCEHSLIYSREAIGFTELTHEESAAFQPVRQRLVRTHPVTGRNRCSCPRMPARSSAGRSRGADVPARPDRARDAARIRLLACMAGRRPGDVGQPHDDAPRPPLRPRTRYATCAARRWPATRRRRSRHPSRDQRGEVAFSREE